MKQTKQTEYRGYLISPLHSTTAVILSILGTFDSCSEGNIFTNSECMNTPKFIHIWALQHTCAWFIVDSFFIGVIIRGTSGFDLQMYAHHFVSVFTWYSTLYFMNFTVVMANAILFVEISTIFISFRWLLYTHGQKEALITQVNTVVSFFAFLIGRFIYMWWLTLKYTAPLLMDELKTVKLAWWQVCLVIE